MYYIYKKKKKIILLCIYLTFSDAYPPLNNYVWTLTYTCLFQAYSDHLRKMAPATTLKESEVMDAPDRDVPENGPETNTPTSPARPTKDEGGRKMNQIIYFVPERREYAPIIRESKAIFEKRLKSQNLFTPLLTSAIYPQQNLLMGNMDAKGRGYCQAVEELAKDEGNFCVIIFPPSHKDYIRDTTVVVASIVEGLEQERFDPFNLMVIFPCHSRSSYSNGAECLDEVMVGLLVEHGLYAEKTSKLVWDAMLMPENNVRRRLIALVMTYWTDYHRRMKDRAWADRGKRRELPQRLTWGFQENHRQLALADKKIVKKFSGSMIVSPDKESCDDAGIPVGEKCRNCCTNHVGVCVKRNGKPSMPPRLRTPAAPEEPKDVGEKMAPPPSVEASSNSESDSTSTTSEFQEPPPKVSPQIKKGDSPPTNTTEKHENDGNNSLANQDVADQLRFQEQSEDLRAIYVATGYDMTKVSVMGQEAQKAVLEHVKTAYGRQQMAFIQHYLTTYLPTAFVRLT